jgi:rRNA pseudouridine-1189 N-methylase Emg1 (Nep1/Mra1 family)
MMAEFDSEYVRIARELYEKWKSVPNNTEENLIEMIARTIQEEVDTQCTYIMESYEER